MARTGSFTRTPNDLLEDGTISASARLLYIILLKYAWTKNQSYPGQKRLAEMVGVDDRTIRTYLKELEEKGLLSVRRRGLTQTNMYTLHKWISPSYERKNNPNQLGVNSPSQNGSQLPTNNTKYKKTKGEKGNAHSLLVEDGSEKQAFSYQEIVDVCESNLQEISFNTGVEIGDIRDVLRKMASYYVAEGKSFKDWSAKLTHWVMKDLEDEKIERSMFVMTRANEEAKKRKIEKGIVRTFGEDWLEIPGLKDEINAFLKVSGGFNTPLKEVEPFLQYLKDLRQKKEVAQQ